MRLSTRSTDRVFEMIKNPAVAHAKRTRPGIEPGPLVPETRILPLNYPVFAGESKLCGVIFMCYAVRGSSQRDNV